MSDRNHLSSLPLTCALLLPRHPLHLPFSCVVKNSIAPARPPPTPTSSSRVRYRYQPRCASRRSDEDTLVYRIINGIYTRTHMHSYMYIYISDRVRPIDMMPHVAPIRFPNMGGRSRQSRGEGRGGKVSRDGGSPRSLPAGEGNKYLKPRDRAEKWRKRKFPYDAAAAESQPRGILRRNPFPRREFFTGPPLI